MVRKPHKLACVLIVILAGNIAHGVNKDDLYLYSMTFYDKFRQIEYWAVKTLSVRDYDHESGDAAYLKLCSEDPNDTSNRIPNNEIAAHYEKEFRRLIQGKIPFHDILKGRSKRLKAFVAEHGVDKDTYDKFKAYEEARNRGMFGSHPGAFYCIIKISRRKFPVLFEMTCKIGADEINYFSAELEEEKLGYSTPEHIVDELKRSMTEQFGALSEELSKIRSIKK